jgi:D-amino-acid dehydrogenase
LSALLRVGLKRATEADYHVGFLAQIAPWLLTYRGNSSIERRIAFAEEMRPLFARALPEHEVLIAEAGVTRYLRKAGWMKLYRSDTTLAATARERELANRFNIPHQVLDRDGALALEPSLAPVFCGAVYWPAAASITNPLELTRAYLARFAALGGVTLNCDARSLRRTGSTWQVDTSSGPVDAEIAVLALGPWTPDVLSPLGLRLPLAVKRGYHRHFRPRGNAGLMRPVVDADVGYCVAPMEQGLRLTTGAEFAPRDAPPTPTQLARLMPAANALFPLGTPVEATPWMGSRPCFADSKPVLGRAPTLGGLWLAYGHAHWGLTLGPATGRLMAEMIAGATPFCDPAPYSAERFTR